MKHNLPDRILRELSYFAQEYGIKKLYSLVLVQEVQTQKEVTLILRYMAGNLIVFIGMLRKKYIRS